MKTSIALGLALVAVAGSGSLARAEQQPSSTTAPTASAPPESTAATEPLAQGVSQESTHEAQPTPQAKPATTAPAAAATTSQPTQAAANAPSGQTAPPKAPPPGKKPQGPEKPETKPPFGDVKPCQDPDSEDGTELTTNCSGIIGVRGSVTRSRGVGPDDAVGLTVSSEGEEYVRRGLWTARAVHRLAIGGGTAGFEGTLLGAWAGGVRLPIAPSRRHGPVLRLGMHGYLRGNDAYYGSLLELPQLQVGYQYMHGKTVVELGATAGAVLVGRSRTGNSARRVLGTGFERGGYVAVQFPWLRLGASGSRLPANDDLSAPVDVLEGSLCGRIPGFAICTDGRATRTDAVVVSGEPASRVRSLYAGLTVGFTRE